MDITSDNQNPCQLLKALIDSFKEPIIVFDNFGHSVTNEGADDLKKMGFDVDGYSKKTKANSIETVTHLGVKYKIEKKDINHGTNCCLCKIIPLDDTIARLTESSKKLKKALNNL